MKSISNDFITIEYDNPKKENLAKQCLDLFSMDKEFFELLLKGKNIFNIDDITLPIFESFFQNKEYDLLMSLMVQIITEENGVKDIGLKEPTNKDLLNALYKVKNHGFGSFKVSCYNLAYYYYLKTNDYSYIKKLLNRDHISLNDVKMLSDYLVSNNLEGLIKEKIKQSIEIIKYNEDIKNNMGPIINILRYMLDKYEEDSNKELEIALQKYIHGIIPEISEAEFNMLVSETLYYIEPSLRLNDKFFELLKENKIEKYKRDNSIRDRNYFGKRGIGSTDYRIVITPKGTIEDVITFMHEFGHLWFYCIGNNKDKDIEHYDEYPSIYFELKTAELLKQKGYSEDEIDAALLNRRTNNKKNVESLILPLKTAYDNMDKDEEDYDVERMLRFYDERIDLDLFEETDFLDEEIKEKIKNSNLKARYDYLLNRSNPIESLKYLLGSYLAEFSINNLNHEEVMDTIKTIKKKKCDLYTTVGLLGMNPEELGFKRTNERKADKKHSLKRENSQ